MFVRRNCMSRFWNRSSKRSSASGPAAEGVAADDEDAFPADEPEGFLTEEPGRNTAVFSEMGRAGASAASYGRTYCSIGTDVDADAWRRRRQRRRALRPRPTSRMITPITIPAMTPTDRPRWGAGVAEWVGLAVVDALADVLGVEVEEWEDVEVAVEKVGKVAKVEAGENSLIGAAIFTVFSL
jgi:hypothetical protein